MDFMERWRLKTYIFYLPYLEWGITYLDVYILMAPPIRSRAVALSSL